MCHMRLHQCVVFFFVVVTLVIEFLLSLWYSLLTDAKSRVRHVVWQFNGEIDE
jgi:hypothetical protein